MRATRQQAETRRDQIAQAVLALVAEQGTSSLSIAAVAKRVGVAPSALYRHYPSKDAMLAGTIERIVQRFSGNVARAREASDRAIDVLARVLELQVQLVRENRGIPFVMFSEAVQQSTTHRKPVLDWLSAYLRALSDLVREAQAQGDIRPELDADVVAVTFVGLYVAPAILWNVTRGRFDVTAQVRRSWSVFLDGVRPSTARSTRPRRARSTKQENPA